MLSLIEETARKVDQDKAQKFAAKLKKTKSFDLEDFREQMLQMQNLGSMQSILEKLPGGAKMHAQQKNVNTDKQVTRTIEIISSLNRQESSVTEKKKAGSDRGRV